jgi:hypothetical protein
MLAKFPDEIAPVEAAHLPAILRTISAMSSRTARGHKPIIQLAWQQQPRWCGAIARNARTWQWSPSSFAGTLALQQPSTPNGEGPHAQPEVETVSVSLRGGRLSRARQHRRGNILGDTTMTEMAAVTAAHVCRLTCLSNRQVRYWDDTGFFSPTLIDEDRRRAFGPLCEHPGSSRSRRLRPEWRVRLDKSILNGYTGIGR